MVARSLPWKGLTHAVVAHRVLTGRRLAVPINADPAMAEVMRRCWEQEPARRPNFEFIYRRLKVRRRKRGGGCLVRRLGLIAMVVSTQGSSFVFHLDREHDSRHRHPNNRI